MTVVADTRPDPFGRLLGADRGARVRAEVLFTPYVVAQDTFTDLAGVGIDFSDTLQGELVGAALHPDPHTIPSQVAAHWVDTVLAPALRDEAADIGSGEAHDVEAVFRPLLTVVVTNRKVTAASIDFDDCLRECVSADGIGTVELDREDQAVERFDRDVLGRLAAVVARAL